MKKPILMLCLAALIIGCSPTKEEKANSLLQSVRADLTPVTKLDSLFDYPESFALRVKAEIISSDVDSLVKKNMAILSEMKAKNMREDMEKVAKQTLETATNMLNTAKDYKQRAAGVELKKSFSKEEKSFLGYEHTSLNDSCKYIVYFDKDITKIYCIKKEDK